MDSLSFFGIYPYELDRADHYCQDVLNHSRMFNKVDEVFEDALENFYNTSWDVSTSITNALITCLFDEVKKRIEKKYPNLEVDIYVNGIDSDIIVNGENAIDFDFENVIEE